VFHENIIIAKEMVHTMHRMKGKKEAFAIKVDLAKAYDKISWEFIWRILVDIKLPDALINVIMHSVTSVMTNVKWNGTRTEFFKPQRGIRQGDPISPYLFVLCMDKLSHIIIKAVEDGRWNGIKAGRNGLMISHLMFADDLLLFGEATEAQMKCVLDSLNLFCAMSGQETSQEKTSVLFSNNVDRGMKNKLLNMSGFKETNNFGNYLGVPLHGKAPKRTDYQYLLDQVSSKLSMWKATHLSFAGRVTLAKSVMEAIPTYPMMSTLIPKSCLDEIQKMQRQFIWGDTAVKRRYHAIGWDRVTLPKWMGGLGLRKLETMNRACLLKLVWKFKDGGDEFWCKVLRSKYGTDMVNGSTNNRATHSSLWRAMNGLHSYVDSYSYWSIGNGRSINAWNQAWIEAGMCVEDMVAIPDNLRGVKVVDLVNGEGNWNWSLLDNWMPEDIKKENCSHLSPE
jgi:mannosylglycoprotein endo-beta-mannosidase